MTDGLPLEERVRRHLEANPDDSAPAIAGALGADPAAIADVLDGDTPESEQDTSSRTRDRVSRSDSRPQNGRGSRVGAWSDWDDADFRSPETAVYPPELLEREQWMGHQGKRPFAPWADRDHPDADSDDDARWKWGITDNYVDGETVSMAEVDPRLDGRAFLQQPHDPYVYVDGDDVRDPSARSRRRPSPTSSVATSAWTPVTRDSTSRPGRAKTVRSSRNG